MIDTDKYKGHTPAPWLWYEDEDLDLVVADDQCRTVIEEVKALNTKADRNLIQDAPLLLAEVKRLRMYEVAWKMLYHNAIEEGRETRTRTWKEIMELVRSDVKEMVDIEDAVFDVWAKQTIGGFE